MAFATIVFYRSSSDLNLVNISKSIGSMLTPFTMGIILAYLLNSSINFLENKVLNKIKFFDNRGGLKRLLSIGSTYVALFGFIIILISYILPEISQSISEIIVVFNNFDVSMIDNLINTYIPLDQSILIEISNFVSTFVKNMISALPVYIGAVLNSTIGLASVVLDIILAIIISIYILSDKESTGKACKNFTYALFNKDFAKNLISLAKEANHTFEKYFVGKIIDSAIIGLIFFVGCIILEAPFAMLLSIIIGITNMIPFFGPFIGGVPVVILTLIFDIANPTKAVFLTIFIVILQQFDGNILGPKILGDSVGLKPIGIVFSVLIFGELFGLAGMFFGVPIFAVICKMFNKFIDKKLIESNPELEQLNSGNPDE
ncbi:MAG: AI-2E family transporter [bacterium]